ncbi:hypothetical protein K440DRAFT_114623 [Wilcoxina mikolae CBS 423.85]|nr:hypothetical protein K440DRAFT_114623 [Wilcoxina mikolae CBS 423.85]
MAETTTPYFILLFAILYYLIQREERMRPCKSIPRQTPPTRLPQPIHGLHSPPRRMRADMTMKDAGVQTAQGFGRASSMV